MRFRAAASATIWVVLMPAIAAAQEGCANCSQGDQIAAEVVLSFERTFMGSYHPASLMTS